MQGTLDGTELLSFTRCYLAVFFTFVALFYTTRILTMKGATQREYVFPGKAFCATWWNHMAFRLFRVLIWWVCLIRLFVPETDRWLGMIDAMITPPVIISGLLLLTLGFAVAASLHWRYGHAWRSGIDPSGPDKLEVNGLYRFSRNPMFIGVGIAQFGFFLALPSLFSMLCLVVGWIALARQVSAEEEHLHRRFPTLYPLYKDRVRRWL
ncbi:isoprenylcysteine carboxylmethyltransferase family protein [Aestuariibacter halophilus]|uniref:Isoprenylcysteine carboxylmethyltransferase family protein n=1 Tax=Fluctibacter halophilus TaxID=226011 RepID=A0ABS8G6P1_9ALTE|nr:isoprenylcysteine carboxylmethyltransferase family protein [Aestuariibacter halophilus]MCC2615510.1 isoprenylcysteine carboxylmethyltransferase family protein [Aestuariibacter halophilus]